MLKTAHPFISKQLELLFNAIFTSSVFLDFCRIQILNPLHKKGDIYQPGNYRGIAIESCLSRLFLSILHGRLVKFAVTNKLIPIHQIGYRKGSRTTDHILTIKSIIDQFINQLQRQYLYACFVDFNTKETSWGLEGPVAYISYHCVSLKNRFLSKCYVLHNIMCEIK